jgi:hypothetical protein
MCLTNNFPPLRTPKQTLLYQFAVISLTHCSPLSLGKSWHVSYSVNLLLRVAGTGRLRQVQQADTTIATRRQICAYIVVATESAMQVRGVMERDTRQNTFAEPCVTWWPIGEC